VLRSGLQCPRMSRSPVRHRARYSTSPGALWVTRMRAEC